MKFIFNKKTFVLISFLFIFACKHEKKEERSETKEDILITMQSDSHIKLRVPNVLKMRKGVQWKDVKDIAKSRILSIDKDYDFDNWYLESNTGSLLIDSYQFNKNETVYATSKKKPSKKIVITISGDEGINVASSNKIETKENTKWKDIKLIAQEKITSKDDYDFVEWRDDRGTIFDETVFSVDKTVFATSKKKEIQNASYKVEHWQQNINDNEYTKVEEEQKTGQVGKNTEAVAKIYEGFATKAITQEKIKNDGSTVIKIEYDRNITTIILNLDEGKTNTPLENGEGGKHLLKGKFGAKVKIEKPTKENFFFASWEPNLPNTFPAQNDSKVYTAKWEVSGSFVYVAGDERVDISEDIKLALQIDSSTTFSNIKSQVEAKIRLKNEWNNGYYGIFEWRENDEDGKLIEDTTQIIQGMKLYAITNYTKFKMEGTKLIGYEGDREQKNRPRGNIIIPKETTEINNSYYNAFSECHEITSVDFSRCINLEKIERYCFYHCKALKNINLSGCINLTSISGFSYCTSLETIDLSPCKNLKTIAEGAFGVGKALKHINLSGLTNITTIEEYAFAGAEGLESIDLSDLINLETIGDNAFVRCYALETIDLSHCKKLIKIGKSAFTENRRIDDAPKLIVKLPESIKILGNYCFGYYNNTNIDFRCKQVVVPNNNIKLKVMATNYPEERIKIE